ncbi:MAG TPA: hypothetical protein VGF71_07590 [Caulobacteraceae bacterium]|jgi:hypothetical protein
MRSIALALAVLLAGCASEAVNGGSYGLAPGVASYDALKSATDKCQADGGELKLRDGYDQHELSSYQCRIGAK